MNVVFANRWLGLRCMQYMLENGDKPDLVVLSRPEQDRELHCFLRANNISCDYYHDMIQKDIVCHIGNEDGSWLINFWSNHILKPYLIERFRHSLNIHPSLVPINRGNDCAAWTIRDDTAAGASLITISPDLDQGDVYCQREIPIVYPERGAVLYNRLLQLGYDLFRENWNDIRDGRILPHSQIGIGTCHTRRNTNQDRVKLAETSMSIDDCITWMLAHDFYPLSTAEFMRDGKRYRLRVEIEEIDA